MHSRRQNSRRVLDTGVFSPSGKYRLLAVQPAPLRAGCEILIDRFILATLEQKNLTPAPEASAGGP